MPSFTGAQSLFGPKDSSRIRVAVLDPTKNLGRPPYKVRRDRWRVCLARWGSRGSDGRPRGLRTRGYCRLGGLTDRPGKWGGMSKSASGRCIQESQDCERFFHACRTGIPVWRISHGQLQYCFNRFIKPDPKSERVRVSDDFSGYVDRIIPGSATCLCRDCGRLCRWNTDRGGASNGRFLGCRAAVAGSSHSGTGANYTTGPAAGTDVRAEPAWNFHGATDRRCGSVSKTNAATSV
jgi:hypothetical protein